MQIPKEVLAKYRIFELSGNTVPENSPPELYKQFYLLFLQNTDYISNKIIEAQFLGETLDEDYAPILEYRKFAREQIS